MVRKMKETKAEKAAVQTEVSKLLSLKKQLLAAEGKTPEEKPPKGKGGKSANKSAGAQKKPAAGQEGDKPAAAMNPARVETLTSAVKTQVS